jgi:uncharacterized membrane protein
MTTPASRNAAQERADAIQVFQQELARLESEGALRLSPEQREAVDAHHAKLLERFGAAFDIDRDLGSKQLSSGMRIASLLGAMALSASVFFLFYQFWGSLTTAAQVTILSSAALGTFALTMWIHQRDSSGYFTNLAATVAFACFVLDLSMLGQIFNVRPTDAALLAWAALAFVLAYGCDLRLMLMAGLACVFAFACSRLASWSGVHWLSFTERPETFFAPAAAMFFAPRFIDHTRRPAFPPTYRGFALLAAFLTMLVLAHWGRGSYLPFDKDTIESGYQWAGFVAAALIAWLGVRKGWRECVDIGVMFFVVFLYTKIFEWWWDSMPKYLFFLVLGLTAVVILLVLRRLRRSGLMSVSGGAS